MAGKIASPARPISPPAAQAQAAPDERRLLGLSPTDWLLVFAMIIWGAHYSIAKAAVDVLPPFVFGAFRFTTGAITVGLIMRVTGESFHIPRREIPRVILIAIALYGVYQSLFINGLKLTTVAHSVLIQTAAPAGVVLFNIITRRERGSGGIWLGIALAVAGVCTVIFSRYAGQIAIGGASTLAGDALTLAGVIVWVGVTLAMRFLMSRNNVMAATFWLLVIGSGIVTALGLPDFATFDWALLDINMILAILFSGCIAIAVAGSIWNTALKKIGASRTAQYVNLQPIVAAAVAVIFLGEPFTIWLVIGMVLVLYGMYRVRVG